MFDIIKKVMLTGVGLAAMTKDKVEEVARDLAKKFCKHGSTTSTPCSESHSMMFPLEKKLYFTNISPTTPILGIGRSETLTLLKSATAFSSKLRR